MTDKSDPRVIFNAMLPSPAPPKRWQLFMDPEDVRRRLLIAGGRVIGVVRRRKEK